jgi:hypothetical protein
MSNLASTLTVLAAFFAAFGGWSVWIKAYLDTRFDHIDGRLERLEDVVLRDHGERIARLEAAR